MMTEMFVIQMMHHRAIGDDLPYYYKGQDRSGENCFDYRKNTAKRYSLKEEALRDMSILKAIHHEDACDDFAVITVRCRI